MSVQQALALELRPVPGFAGLVVPPGAPGLARALAAVQARTAPGALAPLYLYGPAGTGKSHLLLAAASALSARGRTAHYLPLAALRAHLPEVLEQVENAALVCVDQLEAAAGFEDAELGLFALYDRIRAAGGALLMAGRAAPHVLGIRRPELASRLAWGEVCHLDVLDDAGVQAVLAGRARALGLELPDAVREYLYTRAGRALPEQLALLERLDRAALAAQRRLTVPFVRAVLETQAARGA